MYRHKIHKPKREQVGKEKGGGRYYHTTLQRREERETCWSLFFHLERLQRNSAKSFLGLKLLELYKTRFPRDIE